MSQKVPTVILIISPIAKIVFRDFGGAAFQSKDPENQRLLLKLKCKTLFFFFFSIFYSDNLFLLHRLFRGGF